MKKRFVLAPQWMSIALLVLLPVVAAASSNPDETVARISIGATAVQWQPLVPHERLVLKVSLPGGEVVTKEFRSGSNPLFRLQDLPEDLSHDGTYVYELWVIPPVPAEVARNLERARIAGDQAAMERIHRAAGIDRLPIQSGAFTVRQEMFVTPGPPEAGQPSNVISPLFGRRVATEEVIADDLIVTGQSCLGPGCAAGVVFGSEQLLLKGRGVRLKFDDTTADRFEPADDWQLRINDGVLPIGSRLDRFTVENLSHGTLPFTILGGAPSNSLFVDNIGRVGIGTATPKHGLHLSTRNYFSAGIAIEYIAPVGASYGWKIEAGTGDLVFRDITGINAPFTIQDDAPSGSLAISRDGDVSFGSNTWAGRVSIGDSRQRVPRIVLNGQEFYEQSHFDTEGIALVLGVNRPFNRQLWIADSAALTPISANRAVRIYPNGGEIDSVGMDASPQNLILNSGGGNVGIGTVSPTHPLQVGTNLSNGNGAHLTVDGNWTSTSSRTFKEDIQELSLEEAKAALGELKPVRFTYKRSHEPSVGFIAEDVPTLLAQEYDRRYLSAMDIVAALTKVVQGQGKVVEEQVEVIEKQKKQIADLAARLEDLEQK